MPKNNAEQQTTAVPGGTPGIAKNVKENTTIYFFFSSFDSFECSKYCLKVK